MTRQLGALTRSKPGMRVQGRVAVDWSGQNVRPEVIRQQEEGVYLIDILFGLDPNKRPSNSTIYTPDGYPESVAVRIDRTDALRLYERLQIALGLRPCPWCKGSGKATEPGDRGSFPSGFCSRCEGAGVVEA